VYTGPDDIRRGNDTLPGVIRLGEQTNKQNLNRLGEKCVLDILFGRIRVQRRPSGHIIELNFL